MSKSDGDIHVVFPDTLPDFAPSPEQIRTLAYCVLKAMQKTYKRENPEKATE